MVFCSYSRFYGRKLLEFKKRYSQNKEGVEKPNSDHFNNCLRGRIISNLGFCFEPHGKIINSKIDYSYPENVRLLQKKVISEAPNN
jgi:hypothetical protein